LAMDKKGITAISLAIITLVVYQAYLMRTYPQRPVSPAAQAETPSTITPEAAPSATPTPRAQSVPVAETLPAADEKTEEAGGELMRFKVTSRGGGVSDIELLKHQDHGGPVHLNS